MPRIGIIGLGRLGNSLAQALQIDASLRYDQKAGTASAQAVIDQADLLFLALPDDALKAFVERHHWHPWQAVVHTSGSLSLEVLEEARRQGALVGSFHPLQSFGPESGAKKWEGIVVGVEGETALQEWLETLAIQLGATPIPVKARVPYHLAAVMVSNFTTALFGQACHYLGQAGFSPETARQALLPLLAGTLENLEALPPAEALTGPVARGDGETLIRHLDFLEPAERPLYRQLSGLALQLTDQRKKPLEPMARRRLAAILAEKAEEILCERC